MGLQLLYRFCKDGDGVNESVHLVNLIPTHLFKTTLNTSIHSAIVFLFSLPQISNTKRMILSTLLQIQVNGAAADAAVETAEAASASKWDDSAQPLVDEPLSETITIDDFMKVDLRVGRIIEAEQVKEARKLLKLKVSLGGTETRQIFAGIKAAYPEPEKLVGRLIVFVANLAPRQMKFGLSEGMVVAAGPGGPDVFLTSPDEGAQPGQRLH